MTDEAIFTDSDKFAYEAVRLDAGARADACVALNLDKGTDKTVVAEDAAIQIGGTNDRHAIPEDHIADLYIAEDGCAQ